MWVKLQKERKYNAFKVHSIAKTKVCGIGLKAQLAPDVQTVDD